MDDDDGGGDGDGDGDDGDEGDDGDDGDGVDGARGAEIDVSENLARWAFGRNGLALGLEVIHIHIYKYMHVYVFTVRFNNKQWFNKNVFTDRLNKKQWSNKNVFTGSLHRNLWSNKNVFTDRLNRKQWSNKFAVCSPGGVLATTRPRFLLPPNPISLDSSSCSPGTVHRGGPRQQPVAPCRLRLEETGPPVHHRPCLACPTLPSPFRPPRGQRAVAPWAALGGALRGKQRGESLEGARRAGEASRG